MARAFHVWHGPRGWYWDDAEDHGGYDRMSPNGPHPWASAAEADARKVLGSDAEAFPGMPGYYFGPVSYPAEA